MITDAAARAFAEGLISAPPRSCTMRPESVYEMAPPGRTHVMPGTISTSRNVTIHEDACLTLGHLRYLVATAAELEFRDDAEIMTGAGPVTGLIVQEGPRPGGETT